MRRKRVEESAVLQLAPLFVVIPGALARHLQWRPKENCRFLTAKEDAEKLAFGTSGAKAHGDEKAVIAALKRCATQNQSFSAAWKEMPVQGRTSEDARAYITAELCLAGQPLRLRSGQALGGCPHVGGVDACFRGRGRPRHTNSFL